MVAQTGNIRFAAYELTLGHLFRPRAVVRVECISCRHVADLDL
jgi:hypothetical protein